MSPIEIGRITSAISVINGEILSIMIRTPMSVANEVMIVVILWFSPWPSVSTSFVMRESTSPYVRLSKYFIGIRLIFSEISFRS